MILLWLNALSHSVLVAPQQWASSALQWLQPAAVEECQTGCDSFPWYVRAWLKSLSAPSENPLNVREMLHEKTDQILFVIVFFSRWCSRNWMGKNRRNSPSSRAASKGQSLFYILWAETCALPRGCVRWNVASCPHSEKGKFVTEICHSVCFQKY